MLKNAKRDWFMNHFKTIIIQIILHCFNDGWKISVLTLRYHSTFRWRFLNEYDKNVLNIVQYALRLRKVTNDNSSHKYHQKLRY